MRPTLHYTPTESGFSIRASSEIFNRTLYGSHKNDDQQERFFTFAGDAPAFMGAITDWTKTPISKFDKCGVLYSGLCTTPGHPVSFYFSKDAVPPGQTDSIYNPKDIDQTSRWFHNAEDIETEFKNGWMEYSLTQLSSFAPDVRVNIEAYPLMPDDGYLIHYRITTDQRVFFAAGFGGLTGENCRGRFECKAERKRDFSESNTAGNVVEIGKNRAVISHTDGKTMRIATNFPAAFALGSAKAMAEEYPSIFLGSTPENRDDQVVKISAAIEPGQVFDGFVIALYNADESTLDAWLSMADPIKHIKQQMYAKYACMDMDTPDTALDLTIAPTVIALDTSWHKNSFHHGAFAYHAPFLGWRNWYAPTALGWGDRVEKTMETWLQYLTRGDVEEERVWYDDSVIPPEENRFSGRYHKLEKPVGRLPALLPDNNGNIEYGPYTMQECALDMMLYYIEWSGNLKLAEKYFDDFVSMVEWEARMFDPDGDGLYQNLLNTWISDGHNYNGAGCAQSSAYNYRANLVLSKIAKRIGRDGKFLEDRAEKIRKALNEKLWLANEGVIAEYLDTVGNCLIHPSVELPSVYHVMDSEMIDDFKAYRTLKFTENHIKSIVTPGSDGRLSYSSDWLPKQYSNHGIFPAENAHLALVYFKLGLKEEGKKILDGIKDCYFAGKTPGLAAHVQTAKCASDYGDMDFTDVSSTYLRLVVEGLFGIRINHLDNAVYIAPGFPEEWDHASLDIKDISLTYNRKGEQEIFTICCDKEETKIIKIPMRAASVETLLLDGESVPYDIVPAPDNSFIMVKTGKTGRFQLRIIHGKESVPTVNCPENVLAGNRFVVEICGGKPVEVLDISETLEDVVITGNKIYAKTKNIPGDHTLFVRTRSGEYDAWLAADYNILSETVEETPIESVTYETVDMNGVFNCNMTDVHNMAYIHPRPAGYSMGLYQNGRYSHNWTQLGRDVICVDDTLFRNSGGLVHSPSGIPFATPQEKENLACVSIFEVFPTAVTLPLSGKGKEIAVMFIASSNCMLSHVENARITVTYKDGTEVCKKLVYPINLDDWLTSALTTEGEIFYFNAFNHATVQKVRLDPEKELKDIKVEAVANDVILGVGGISIGR
ncbi:MAG: hypothetical protein IJB91_03155 [Oscillospiraceae bacterium]|nr:hypothetical protein [Oscillospiraceae bacterium]MBQ3146711.1 hypothetical protein [Oscillospiraceae bacterium]